MKQSVLLIASFAIVIGEACAQSSVTLYGTIDGGLMYQTSSAASFSPKAKNTGSIARYKDGGIYGSFWGMTGVEDLGGGYKATFQLQSNFDTGTGKVGLGDTPGTATLFNQVATIGATGPFGSLKLGRQYAPMILALTATDARHAGYFGSILTALVGINTAAGWPGTSTNGQLGSVYDSNAIVYTSPKFLGLSATLGYAPGGVAGSLQGNTRESAVLQYDNNGLKAAAIYYNGHDSNPTATTVPTGLANNRFYSFSALYYIAGFTVSGSYSNGRNPAQSSAMNYDMISGGLGYRFTPAFAIDSGVYYLRDQNHTQNQSTEYAVGANYNLSKSTLVYANFGYVNNRGTMNQTIVYGQPVAPSVGTSAVMIGMRHGF
ncbi:porin [Paraburkholderia nodosa]|uniref:porin n=1 Tax=Paraburkholderia nodosa TaxID=392320 RepID=UPI0004866D22|nr:porin [Paraburkholderia nodosa]